MENFKEELQFLTENLGDMGTDYVISKRVMQAAEKIEENEKLEKVAAYLHGRQDEARRPILCLLDAMYGDGACWDEVLQLLDTLVARSVATGVFLGMVTREDETSCTTR